VETYFAGLGEYRDEVDVLRRASVGGAIEEQVLNVAPTVILVNPRVPDVHPKWGFEYSRQISINEPRNAPQGGPMLTLRQQTDVYALLIEGQRSAKHRHKTMSPRD